MGKNQERRDGLVNIRETHEEFENVYGRLNTLDRHVAKQGNSIENLVDVVRRLSDSFEKIREIIAVSAKTDWKSIWGAAGVVVVVVSMGITLLVNPLYREIEHKQDEIDSMKEQMSIIERSQFDIRYQQGRLDERTEWLKETQDERYRHSVP